jgi:hypothetical protein
MRLIDCWELIRSAESQPGMEAHIYNGMEVGGSQSKGGSEQKHEILSEKIT